MKKEQNITGTITQIIPPEDHGNYMLGHQFARSVRGKYLLVLTRDDVPVHQPFLEKLRWWWKHRKETKENKYWWDVVMDECSYHKGDRITLQVEPFLPAVEIWTTN